MFYRFLVMLVMLAAVLLARTVHAGSVLVVEHAGLAGGFLMLALMFVIGAICSPYLDR